jgi:Domain of unknown function (DUF4265)
MVQTLQLLAGSRDDGSPVYEEVRVEPIQDGRYRLMQSPGLVMGLAAGDVFVAKSGGQFDLETRGGNICVQIFCDQADAVEPHATKELASIGGWLDGKAKKELVFTIAASVGFPEIERVLDTLKLVLGVEWYYGNVYDPIDGVTPLNWW